MSVRFTKQFLKKQWLPVVAVLLAVALVGMTAWGIHENNQSNSLRAQNNAGHNHTNTSVSDELNAHGITPLTSAKASNNTKTAEELAYLLEEEKLAHDVYLAMYDRWGSRVFGNIQNSEATHQGFVLAVMKSRNLADPRSDQVGVFTNQDLQKLYDELIARGNQSATEAYKVGIAVEEKDIADLKNTLAKLDAKDTDIKDVLENLLHGSENHLRAFNRQARR